MVASPEAKRAIENAKHLIQTNADWLDGEIEKARIEKLKAGQDRLQAAIRNRKLREAHALFEEVKWLIDALENKAKFDPEFAYEASGQKAAYEDREERYA